MTPRRPALHEQTVTGNIIYVGPEKKDEAIVFEIPMGDLKIVAIVNIPADDEESAPVYLKWRLAGPNQVARTFPRSVESRPTEEGETGYRKPA